MNYIYYKAQKGNFGDDLNAWIWPNFFGEHNDNDNIAFLGIGSILYNDFPLIKSLTSQRKIVFGSGVRLTYDQFKYDSSWDIKFLRGPLSASALGGKNKHIIDAAYTIRLMNNFDEILATPKKYDISIFPYFKSIDFFDWPQLCKKMNFHYISPESEFGVEHTLKEIAASKFVITEAMHGAILADVLRVPWHRFVLSTPFTEGPMVSEFKWMDWLYSINLPYPQTTFIKFFRKTFLNKLVYDLSLKTINAEFLFKKKIENDIITNLSSPKEYYLSSDSLISEINSRLFDEIHTIKNEIL
ncbi:polysaccharide pyruvyl transferase family protein [Emticicia sp. W12TSBA100-4]|uniref:polysaccharide pyruvyl transferase family protein n=1 Tax=Emticicia sp. W12TSBA100-4 TaxID=3160965 RepID=UPI003306548C